MDEHYTILQKELYEKVGELSILYAKLEFNVSKILSMLINSDDETISIYLLERNTLQKNLELLRNFNRLRDFRSDDIEQLMISINKVKDRRNLFIHGLWSKPSIREGQKIAYCEERKIKYTKQNERGHQQWNFNTFYKFTYDDLGEQIGEIRNIIDIQKRLIKELDDYRF